MPGRVVVYLLGVLTMSGCATFEAGAPQGAIDVIAHRGASAYAPENTLAAFEKAVDLEADWFELDCTLSADGEVVVIHDDDLLRTTGAEGDIRDLSYAAIRHFDAGTWFSPEFNGERIPTLREALELAKGRIGVYIEIKNSDDDEALLDTLMDLGKDYDRFFPEYERLVMRHVRESGTRNRELAEKVVALVRELDMRDQIVIQSFSPVVCAAAMSAGPELRVELLATSSDEDPEMWGRFQEWRRLLNPAGFNVNKKDVTPELIDTVRAEGRTIAVWTVNEDEDLYRLRDLGVDAIITDRPDAALRVLER